MTLAHATHWINEAKKGVPVPDSSNQYGLWHAWTTGPHPYHKFGYGKYKFLIGEEFNDPDMYFYIDYTDCDYTDHYDLADVWIKFDTDSII